MCSERLVLRGRCAGECDTPDTDDCGVREKDAEEVGGDAGEARSRSSTMRSSSSMSSGSGDSSMEHLILLLAVLLRLTHAASMGSREMLADGVRTTGELSGPPREAL